MAAFDATYTDGQSAARHHLRMKFGVDRLVGQDADGVPVLQWSYGGIQLIDHDKKTGIARLTHAASDEARLTLQRPDLFETLCHYTPGLSGRGSSSWGGFGWAAAAGVTTVALLVVLYLSLPLLSSYVAALVPLSWQINLGEQAKDQLTALFNDGEPARMCDSPAGRAVVDDLATRMAAVAGIPEPSLYVADVDTVNAFALPGGIIVLFRGLIDEAESPDEVVGVLAHELGHVAEQHPIRAMIRSMGVTLLTQVFLGTDTLGDVAGVLVGFSYSRENEEEADAFAMSLLRDMGVRTDGLARFFNRLASMEEEIGLDNIPAFLSTHPETATRAQMIERAGKSGADGLTDTQWADLQLICK